jgi:hypothetical protein
VGFGCSGFGWSGFGWSGFGWSGFCSGKMEASPLHTNLHTKRPKHPPRLVVPLRRHPQPALVRNPALAARIVNGPLPVKSVAGARPVALVVAAVFVLWRMGSVGGWRRVVGGRVDGMMTDACSRFN